MYNIIIADRNYGPNYKNKTHFEPEVCMWSYIKDIFFDFTEGFNDLAEAPQTALCGQIRYHELHQTDLFI